MLRQRLFEQEELLRQTQSRLYMQEQQRAAVDNHQTADAPSMYPLSDSAGSQQIQSVTKTSRE